MIDAVDERLYLNRKILKFSASLSPAIVAANASVEQSLGAGSWAAGDMIIKIEKPTDQAGLALVSGRVDASGNLQLKFANVTAAGITPTAAEVYQILVAR